MLAFSAASFAFAIAERMHFSTWPAARFFENRQGPFARDQRFVIRADDDPASLVDGVENKVCGRDAHRADNGGEVA